VAAAGGGGPPTEACLPADRGRPRARSRAGRSERGSAASAPARGRAVVSGGWVRGLVGLVVRLLEPLYPARWASAMRSEIEQVEDDREALLFALGCVRGGLRDAAARLISGWNEGVARMTGGFGRLGGPRGTGIACALAATALGIVYLIAAGAPVRYPVVNAAAFLLGVVALRGLDRAGRAGGAALLALGTCLLATALFGA